jgi:uncharacterized coiled-coil protein SlyX
MLLNEFLKEHRKVEQQQATIGRLETMAAKQETNIAELKSNVSPSTPMTCLAHQRTLANKNDHFRRSQRQHGVNNQHGRCGLSSAHTTAFG